MSTLEDRLRDAYRAAADVIDPATVPSPPAGTHQRAARSRRIRILTPLAAAAAVVLVVVATTLAGGASPRHHTRPAPPRPATPTAVLPAYTIVDLGSSLQVYATRTGARVAALRPPAGQQFQDVASGGTAGTFLAATGLSGSGCHAYFYRFHLSATGQPSALRFLRSAPDSQPTAITGISGGSTYAYSTVHCNTAPPNGGAGISGPAGHRFWTYPTGDDYSFSLSATADGRTLALSFYVYGPGFENMLLDTKSPARTAAGASRALPLVPASPTLAISPDGGTLYACTAIGTTGTLASYSTTSGARLRVLREWPLAASGGGGYSSPGFSCQISTDPAGRYLLAAVSFDNPPHHWRLVGFDLRTGGSAKVPIRSDLPFRGTQAAW